MEQTLGKRIALHRKRLNLTQDQLAEKLGITAQAVSKWENDLSCPDINMLPRLAEIFGISIDELLGREAPEKVHQTEVVEDEEDSDDSGVFNLSFHSKDDNGKWVFRWDSGKKNAVLFAVWVLIVGVTYLLSKWFMWDVSFWSIMWPSFMLVYGFAGISPKFSAFHLGVALFGGYFLVHNLGLWQLDIAGELIFPICIVLFGAGLLIDALRKPNKPRFRIVKNGDHSHKTKRNCENHENRFTCALSFGEYVHAADIPLLAGGDITVSFGELTVDLTDCEEIAPNCTIDANCSFGELLLLVPRKFRIEPDISTAFASYDVKGQPDEHASGVIHLDANVSFGEVCVKYI